MSGNEETKRWWVSQQHEGPRLESCFVDFPRAAAANKSNKQEQQKQTSWLVGDGEGLYHCLALPEHQQLTGMWWARKRLENLPACSAVPLHSTLFKTLVLSKLGLLVWCRWKARKRCLDSCQLALRLLCESVGLKVWTWNFKNVKVKVWKCLDSCQLALRLLCPLSWSNHLGSFACQPWNINWRLLLVQLSYWSNKTLGHLLASLQI